MRSTLLPLVLTALALVGCGTVIGQRRAPVHLTSFPAGADVFVDGVHRGKTPLVLDVSTAGAHRVEFKLAGRTGACELGTTTSGMWIAFDLAMGLVPLVVDAVTGGLRTLDHNACHATF